MATSAGTGLTYDPNAKYEVDFHDIEYLRHGDEALLARVYQPKTRGPFPGLVAIHGGAWSGKEWLQNELNHAAIAEAGAVVMAIQFRTSVDAPHPAAMEDINYAIRLMKAHASEFEVAATAVGGVGWSSGGHQIMLSAMRPAQYATLPLPEAPNIDARLAYVILGWPVIDPLSRYRFAKEGRAVPASGGSSEQMAERHLHYFGDEAGMTEANPQHILECGEEAELPPTLLLQGAADQQLTPGMAEAFVRAYSEAGGVIELGKYPGEPHGFLRNPGPNRDRGLSLIKSFIARQLQA